MEEKDKEKPLVLKITRPIMGSLWIYEWGENRLVERHCPNEGFLRVNEIRKQYGIKDFEFI